MVIRKLRRRIDMLSKLRRERSIQKAAWNYANQLETALEEANTEIEQLRIENQLLRSGATHREQSVAET